MVGVGVDGWLDGWMDGWTRGGYKSRKLSIVSAFNPDRKQLRLRTRRLTRKKEKRQR